MTRFTRSQRAAAIWLVALTVLLAAPRSARAEDCTSQFIQCMAENGGSTQCPHEYIACVSRSILLY